MEYLHSLKNALMGSQNDKGRGYDDRINWIDGNDFQSCP